MIKQDKKLKLLYFTRVNIKMMSKKAMVNIDGHPVTIIKDITKMIRDISMVKCTGMMEVFIKENGAMEFNMVTER